MTHIGYKNHAPINGEAEKAKARVLGMVRHTATFKTGHMAGRDGMDVD